MNANSSGTVDLFWLPLGAGGWLVRFNGRIYELLESRREHRPALDLYHTALEVNVPDGRFIIENAWPIPDSHPEARGVTVQGPVWARPLGRCRIFRYEVRRWRDGAIPDVAYAVSRDTVSHDENRASRVLELATQVPQHVWGRDEAHVGEMWNSNSVISWLLTRAGIATDDIHPPDGGRAPGWRAGISAALGMQIPERGVPYGSSGVHPSSPD